ncbi:unnamed protein product, partial [marine sediment metagenome]
YISYKGYCISSDNNVLQQLHICLPGLRIKLKDYNYEYMIIINRIDINYFL